MLYLLILLPALGLAPAFIAHNKGRNFILWWVYGTILGIVALPHAILLRDIYPDPFNRERRQAGSPLPVVLWTFASLIIAAVAVFAYRFYVPGDTTRAASGQIAHSPGAEAPIPPVTPKSAVPKAAAPKTETAAPAASVALPKPVPVEPAATLDSAVSADRKHESLPPPEAPETPAKKTFVPIPVPPLAMSTVAPPPLTSPTDGAKSADAAAPAELALLPPQEPEKKAPPKKTPIPETEVNAIGEMVYIVQKRLAERGYKPGKIDGRAHKQTQQAIRLFQKDRGLTPTGRIDHTLLMNLNVLGPKLTPFQTPRVTPPKP